MSCQAYPQLHIFSHPPTTEEAAWCLAVGVGEWIVHRFVTGLYDYHIKWLVIHISAYYIQCSIHNSCIGRTPWSRHRINLTPSIYCWIVDIQSIAWTRIAHIASDYIELSWTETEEAWWRGTGKDVMSVLYESDVTLYISTIAEFLSSEVKPPITYIPSSNLERWLLFED